MFIGWQILRVHSLLCSASVDVKTKVVIDLEHDENRFLFSVVILIAVF